MSVVGFPVTILLPDCQDSSAQSAWQEGHRNTAIRHTANEQAVFV